MTNSKPYLLIVVLILIAGAIYYIGSLGVERDSNAEVVTVSPRTVSTATTSSSSDIATVSKNGAETKISAPKVLPPAPNKAKQYELAKEITTPDGFINRSGISIGELVGKKVILIDFWTYSCINCQRTTPYLNAWYEKYRGHGLEIIGIHTPEFEFEKDYVNVQAAVEKFGIKFPVVLDNDYSTWFAYQNRYWPRKYLIDIDGYVVYDHIGEGGYEETEKRIQELLTERKQILGLTGETVPMGTAKPLAETRSSQPISPETYFGSSRGSNSKNYLVGDWQINPEYAENRKAGDKIVYQYQAKKVYLVAGADQSTEVKILINGQPAGTITVQANQLYEIVSAEAWGKHTLELIVSQPGLKIFTFTFG